MHDENLIIKGPNVILRDLIQGDMNDYERWFFTETEWQKWDALWESSCNVTQSYLDRLKLRIQKEPSRLKTRMEIWVGDSHIGWVTSYLIDNKPDFLSVGINIAETSFWGKGFGKEALTLWIKYLFQSKKPEFLYCETWNGNARMVKLALSLGFEIIDRYSKVETDGIEYQKLKFRISEIIT